jgi:uncharacterized protein YtpQ (UPF0354 family)
MADHIPSEPHAFAEHVVSILRAKQPEFAVLLTGPSELIVNGRRLDLENLYRMVQREPERGSEIVEHYIEQLFEGDSLQMVDLPFELARERIMPRIQPESIFQHLNRELVAHIPFVNNTVVVFVTDLPNMTVSITTEQMIQWGLATEDLEQIARENLEGYAPDLHVQLIHSKDGGKAAILSNQDGYDAARLLMSNLYNKLAPQLGRDFLVATPARDMFVAMTAEPKPFIERLKSRVEQDYKRLPYPITSELFIVTRDGVAGTGEEGHDESSEAA